MSPQSLYKIWRQFMSPIQIESLCRQVITLSLKEQMEEKRRLDLERLALLTRLETEKHERKYVERPWDDAPGVIL